MITIFKKESNRISLNRKPLEEVAEMFTQGSLISTSRCKYEVGFTAEIIKRGGKLSTKALNGLCLLKVQNLAGQKVTAEAVLLAKTVPYTVMVCQGEDHRSLIIVARYDWQKSDSPLSEEQMLRLHTNAYNQLHYAYSVQLHMSIDTEKPSLQTTCELCHDANTYFNPDARAFRVQEEKVHLPQFQLPATGRAIEAAGLFSSSHEAMCHQYQWAYHQAFAEARSLVGSQEMLYEKCLNLLAAYCHQEGLEMEFCISQTCWKEPYWNKEDYVRLAFTTAYEEDLHHLVPFGHVDKSALLMMRIKAYLNSRYEMRRNRLTGIVEFRSRNHYEYTFRPLTEQEINTMTTGALMMGLQSWDKDLRRILNSTEIPEYDPLEDYLDSLPQWDGKDHVAALCKRIPTDTPNYQHYLHIWLLSMVAHWLGKDRQHGNALVPLLIGAQGCGKTTFCNMLLPEELRIYFNDKIDFRSEGDIMSALSNYALINIDEFDSLKKSQQPLLKYLLSKSEVRFRPPYGKAIVERRRYASFIATTNCRHPLFDRTGSRRFACIHIRENEQIDFSTQIDHEQLFAQLISEIASGRRFWLDSNDIQELQANNSKFIHISDASEIIDLVLTVPADSNPDSTNWRSLPDIIHILRKHFPSIEPSYNFTREVSTILRDKSFPAKRTNAGVRFLVAER